MKYFFALIVFGFSITVMASDHREQGAHVHGSAKMNIAFDGLNGEVELNGPGDSIVGFEHKPTSESDKKTQAEALEKLEKQIGEMVFFDSSLSCEWKKEKIDIHHETNNHSNIEASWKVRCKKSVIGSQLIMNIQSFFPKVKDLDVQILVDTIQISAEAKKSKTSIKIK